VCAYIKRLSIKDPSGKEKETRGASQRTQGEKGQKRETRNHSANKLKRRKENTNEID
jgi:hypothetical protein